MNKVFYSISLLLLLTAACTSSTDNGAIAEAGSGLDDGESGTFTFLSKDSLPITADYYPCEDATKLIILMHQAGFSRAEYKDIAPRLVDSGFACVAIDLRSGKLVNQVFNETAREAERRNLKTGYIDAKQDVEAAVQHISAHTDKEIILWGSSYSASLALMVGAKMIEVSKVVAFSPGEYLSNQSTVRSAVINLNKPVYITGAAAEYDMIVRPIIGALIKAQLTEYKPQGQSDHGSKTLWQPGKATQTQYNKITTFLRF